MITPVRWDGDRLVLLDQTRLPTEEVERAYTRLAGGGRRHPHARRPRGARHRRRRRLRRGARRAAERRARLRRRSLADLEEAIKGLAATRPTAVNLFWALDRMRRLVVAGRGHAARPRCASGCSRRRRPSSTRTSPPTAPWARTARRWCPTGARILTHCNAGALATAGYGTALGRDPRRARAGQARAGLGGRDAPGACRARGSPRGSWSRRASRTGSSRTWRRAS